MTDLFIPQRGWSIRVYGEPQVWPKKDIAYVGKGKNKRPRLIEQDYRTRKNPITGEKEIYDRGYKRRWFDHVRLEVLRFMARHKLKPYPKGFALAWSTIFFVTKPESSTADFPNTGDEDNYDYGIRNALKRTPRKRVGSKLVDGAYPQGVLFYDDDQPKWRRGEGGLLWADENHPPGVIIRFCPIGMKLKSIEQTLAEATAELAAQEAA